MNDAWKKYAADFNAMSDEAIAEVSRQYQYDLDAAEDWLEAVAFWEAAGKPRGEPA